MEWTDAIQSAISFIEQHITDDITAEDVANHVHISSFYFQKGFSMLCGYSVTEYIRNRRLALAGGALAATDMKIIDIAMKYGYDSPDSFTKAFTRFHGVSPAMVRKNDVTIKTFAPLKLEILLTRKALQCLVRPKNSNMKIASRKSLCFGRSIMQKDMENMSGGCSESI